MLNSYFSIITGLTSSKKYAIKKIFFSRSNKTKTSGCGFFCVGILTVKMPRMISIWTHPKIEDHFPSKPRTSLRPRTLNRKLFTLVKWCNWKVCDIVFWTTILTRQNFRKSFWQTWFIWRFELNFLHHYRVDFSDKGRNGIFSDFISPFDSRRNFVNCSDFLMDQRCLKLLLILKYFDLQTDISSALFISLFDPVVNRLFFYFKMTIFFKKL